MSSPSPPSRLLLAVGLLLIAGCVLAALWMTASPLGAPSAASGDSEDTPAPPAFHRAAFGGRTDVPLSPLAPAGVHALGGTRGGAAQIRDWLSVELPPTLPPPVRLSSVPITVPLRPGVFADYDSSFDAFDDEFEGAFSDEAAPFFWIVGDNDAMLTPGFRVADFASRDGSTLARISYRLVEGLEHLRQQAGSLGILSGYRNAAHNAAVGGVAHSQHLAGKAADVWSEEHLPLDLARLALQTLGCEIGLGLGPRSLHVDVRGELTTWTYPGAAMPDAAFDAWALAQCGRPVPAELAQRAAEAWLTEAGSAADTAFADTSATALLARFHTEAAEAARAGYDLEGPGAVVLDFRAGVPPPRYLPPSHLRYVAAGTPEAAEIGIAELVTWRERGRQHTYFVYAVLLPDALPAVGVSSFAARRAAPEPRPEAAESSAPAASVGETWTLVVASHLREERAVAATTRYRSVLHVAVTYDDESERYRIPVGQFPSSEAAQHALDTLRGEVPADAWVHRL